MLPSLVIGIAGYKFTIPEFDWYDSLLNASMILSGMGPAVDSGIVLSNKAKVFSSVYALFSGITFLSTLAAGGTCITPFFSQDSHRRWW